MEINITNIQPTYKKDNGLWVLDIDKVQFPPDFHLRYRALAGFPPGAIGGNHKHPRREIMIGVGEEMEFHWLDNEGKKHMQRMNNNGEIYLIHIPPYIPHAVVNRSASSTGTMFEFADDEQHDVEAVAIISL